MHWARRLCFLNLLSISSILHSPCIIYNLIHRFKFWRILYPKNDFIINKFTMLKVNWSSVILTDLQFSYQLPQLSHFSNRPKRSCSLSAMKFKQIGCHCDKISNAKAHTVLCRSQNVTVVFVFLVRVCFVCLSCLLYLLGRVQRAAIIVYDFTWL